MRRPLPLLLILGLCSWVTSQAAASGLFLHDRGARALGRGFALVAGADDPAALWYNPAGLAQVEGRALLADTTLTLSDAEFTRVDSGGRTLRTVSADPLTLPIPTVGYADDFGLEDFTFGVGFSAPSSALLRWPDDRDAPQRYSLISLEGTLLIHTTLGVAWKTPLEGLTVGAAPGMVFGSFQARLALGTCEGAICTQPENPDYDAVSELRSDGIQQPVLTLGATYDVWKLRIGASVTTPYNLDEDADLRVRIPSAAIFENAAVRGNTAETSIPIPWIVRMGVEARPLPALRVELAMVLEAWSRQEEIPIEPKNVSITGVEGVGDYQVGPLALPRRMKDTVSVRLGGEYELLPALLVLRAGIAYEPDAFEDAFRSPLTMDSDKVIIGLGGSYKLEDFWFDGGLGHVFMSDNTVANSRVNQQNPIRPAAVPVPIGNGQYSQGASVLAVGLRWVPGSDATN